MLRIILFLGLLVFLLPGCYINSNLMLKTDKNFVFDTIPDTIPRAYTISPNDLISFRLFANDGFKLIDIASGLEGQSAASNRNMFQNPINCFYNW